VKQPSQDLEDARAMLRKANKMAGARLRDDFRKLPHCGTPGCQMHRKGPKHGTPLYVSYQGQEGKTTGRVCTKVSKRGARGAMLGPNSSTSSTWRMNREAPPSQTALDKNGLSQQGLDSVVSHKAWS